MVNLNQMLMIKTVKRMLCCEERGARSSRLTPSEKVSLWSAWSAWSYRYGTFVVRCGFKKMWDVTQQRSIETQIENTDLCPSQKQVAR
jgi:hypothetical protein